MAPRYLHFPSLIISLATINEHSPIESEVVRRSRAVVAGGRVRAPCYAGLKTRDYATLIISLFGSRFAEQGHTYAIKNHISAIMLMFVSTLSHTQDKTNFISSVHVFMAGGPNLNGSGFASVGVTVDAGVIVDAPHFFSYSEAGYERGGRLNDSPDTNSAGHTRLLANQTLVRIGNWYTGVGVDWNKLYTPDHNWSSVHPKATVGREFYSGYVNKVLVSYVAPGTDWADGLQGFEAQGWWTGKHIFLRMTLGSYRYHLTVTDRTNIQMANYQRSNKSMTCQFQTVLGWRF